MDPNEGSVNDAIVVHCDMEQRSTCVLPQPGMTQEYNWVGRQRGVTWLGETIQPDLEVIYSLSTDISFPNILVL